MEKHYLSEVDIENRTALCKKCGPVSLAKQGKNKYRCSVAKAEHRGKAYPSKDPVTMYEFEGGRFYLKRSEKNALKKGQVCSICKEDKPLVIDHCHQTGRIRGVVCTHCNWLLGHAKDNPDVLAQAIEYLKA